MGGSLNFQEQFEKFFQMYRKEMGPSVEGSGSRGSILRFAKMDFPSYDGNTDPWGWLSWCEYVFKYQGMPEEGKVGLATFHLVGNAQLWFLRVSQDHPDLLREEFKQSCNVRYGPMLGTSKSGELSKLRQMRLVTDYDRRFEQLMACVEKLRPNQEVEIYVSGLHESIKVEVELHNLPDLSTTMNLARLFERRMAAQNIMPNNCRMSTSGPTNLPSTTPFVKRLSRAEMAERRVKGLCFNCEEQFTSRHQCKRLFWLELAGDSDDVEEDDRLYEEADSEISLHAISRIKTP